MPLQEAQHERNDKNQGRTMEAALFVREGKRKHDHQQQTHLANFMQAGNKHNNFKRNGRNFVRNHNHQANAVQLPVTACFLCGKTGHVAENCTVVTPAWWAQRKTEQQQQEPKQAAAAAAAKAAAAAAERACRCHNCGQPGHYKHNCPHPQQQHRATPAFIVSEEADRGNQRAHFANATCREQDGNTNKAAAGAEDGNQLIALNNAPPEGNLPGGAVQPPPSSAIVPVRPMCLSVALSPQLHAGVQLSRIIILLVLACTAHIVT